MSEQNNNNDDWSNRNWQDAGNFGGFGSADPNSGPGAGGRGNFGRSLFGSTLGGQGYNGNAFGTNGNDNVPSSGKLGSGWLAGRNSMSVVIVVLIIIIIYSFYSQTSMNAGVTRSTAQRTKIETSSFNPEADDFYYDEYGAVEDDKALASAAQYFFNKTGVIPYVYFSSEDEPVPEDVLIERAEEFYKDNFKDQDHFMICIDTKTTSYTVGTYTGETAKGVMDDEAVQIFKDFLDKYYAARQTENQTYMVNTYRYAAERMMSTLPFSVRNMVIGVIAVIILVVVIIYYVRKRSREENEESGI